MRVCWLVPDDKSGGVLGAAMACCEQAARAGCEATLLTVIAPSNSQVGKGDYRTASLGLTGSATESPQVLLKWLLENPQEILFLNGCEQVETVIPYLPPNLKCIQVIHDTAPRYWSSLLREEDNLDAIVAVSQVVANQFYHKLKNREKLFVIHNGCTFPDLPVQQLGRPDELVFMGGDNFYKGAHDVLEIWGQLHKLGFSGKLHWFGNINPTFQEKIARLPQMDNIILHGHVKRELIYSTCATAKVVLVLSRSESFGLATVEAMSMGCVPVTWDIETGTKEIVIKDVTGLYAELGNYKAFAQQILFACKKYATFESTVITTTRERFNQETMWSSYQSLISQMIQQKPLMRSKAGLIPPGYKFPTRYFQLLPLSLRSAIRRLVGRSPHLGYRLRNFRGF